MSTVPPSEGEWRISPALEAIHWQRRLFEHLLKHGHVRQQIQVLCRLWKAARSELAELYDDDDSRFGLRLAQIGRESDTLENYVDVVRPEEIIELLNHPDASDLLSSTVRYFDELRIVAQRFHLVRDGEIPLWAVDHLHAAATGTFKPGTNLTKFGPWFRASVYLAAYQGGTLVCVTYPSPNPFKELRRPPRGRVGMIDWDQFEQDARTAASEAVADVRR